MGRRGGEEDEEERMRGGEEERRRGGEDERRRGGEEERKERRRGGEEERRRGCFLCVDVLGRTGARVSAH